MKKSILAAAAAMGVAASASAQEIKLPEPSKTNEMTLMTALSSRQSSREYSSKEIDNNTLSTILWAACGINRPESGRITAPSAINAQDIQVYVIRKDGAWLYLPSQNSLKKVSGKDLRSLIAGRQEFASAAPLSLLLVSDHSKFGDMPAEATSRMGLIDSGYVSENICLACTALGLATVPRMSMDSDGLRKELGLGANQDLTINNPVGYPAE